VRIPGIGLLRRPHVLAGGYALDALDGGELTRFERHLRTCRTCPDEVRGFAATATQLGLAAAAAPPPSLKSAVLGAVGALSSARDVDAAIAAVLSAPDARIVSGATSAGGTATAVASRSGRTVVFTSTGLPVLPPTSVYELWFIGSGGARPAGLLPPAPSGAAGAASGTTTPLLASGLASGDAVGITVEPAGGTQSPTTTPIVVLAL
jgi:anti-sigma-K factor RskA